MTVRLAANTINDSLSEGELKLLEREQQIKHEKGFAGMVGMFDLIFSVTALLLFPDH
jgi:hypothetical protein